MTLKGFFCYFVFILLSTNASNQKLIQLEKSTETKAVSLSYQLIHATKNNFEVKHITDQLANISVDQLQKDLKSDLHKKVFWINIYNANIQILLKENPDLYKHRERFFSSPRIIIAGKKLGFDDIEHGMIRSSNFKLGLGYIQNPFISDYERKLRCEEVDYRIHFALNCGAISCPPVALYNTSNFNTLVNQVSIDFLKAQTSYAASERTVYTSPLFSWYRGDFGGEDEILRILHDFKVIPEHLNLELEYIDYDWTLKLDNYYD